MCEFMVGLGELPLGASGTRRVPQSWTIWMSVEGNPSGLPCAFSLHRGRWRRWRGAGMEPLSWGFFRGRLLSLVHQLVSLRNVRWASPMAFAVSSGSLCMQVDGPEYVANLGAIFNGVVLWRLDILFLSRWLHGQLGSSGIFRTSVSCEAFSFSQFQCSAQWAR